MTKSCCMCDPIQTAQAHDWFITDASVVQSPPAIVFLLLCALAYVAGTWSPTHLVTMNVRSLYSFFVLASVL